MSCFVKCMLKRSQKAVLFPGGPSGFEFTKCWFLQIPGDTLQRGCLNIFLYDSRFGETVGPEERVCSKPTGGMFVWPSLPDILISIFSKVPQMCVAGNK